MNDFLELAQRIKGFLAPDEGKRLYQIATLAAAMGPCLEIGSYCGKSALYLGQACKENGQVLFSIDHHRGSEEQQPGEEYFDVALFDVRAYRIDTFSLFRRTLELADLEESVVPIVAPSAVAARSWATPLALVFIDGGHALETVQQDFDSWARHLMPGGYLLIHDLFEDPAQGGQAPFQVYQAAVETGQYHELSRAGTLGVLQRKQD